MRACDRQRVCGQRSRTWVDAAAAEEAGGVAAAGGGNRQLKNQNFVFTPLLPTG